MVIELDFKNKKGIDEIIFEKPRKILNPEQEINKLKEEINEIKQEIINIKRRLLKKITAKRRKN